MLGGVGLGLGVLLHSPLLALIGQINFVLAAFNLIPALPMDGGRILRALLSRKMGFVRATDVAVQVARVAAVGFAVVGLAIGSFQLVVLAPLLWIMGTQERHLARTTADPYSGRGRGDVLGRFAGPFDQGPSRREPSGYDATAGLPLRRFTIRQVGGRLVIEQLD
jgi:peptidase M50-like protein